MAVPSGPRARLTALGTELIEIHQWLRDELTGLRSDVGAFLAGRGERPRPLKAHCLAFCTALTRHHRGEDAGAFVTLAREYPELGPTIDKLVADHRLVRSLQDNIEGLLDGITDEPDPAQAARVRAELDGLSAILESHFRFEERRIAAALDTLPAEAGTAESLLGLPVPGTS